MRCFCSSIPITVPVFDPHEYEARDSKKLNVIASDKIEDVNNFDEVQNNAKDKLSVKFWYRHVEGGEYAIGSV